MVHSDRTFRTVVSPSTGKISPLRVTRYKSFIDNLGKWKFHLDGNTHFYASDLTI